ncbi:MAG: PleD family two-component system response regulator [Promethearchaeota archaeon]
MLNSKPRILIVDDNPDILFNLKIMLEVEGYEVETATRGDTALNLLLSGEKIPDVIMSDIVMPNMNGYEFFSVVSSHPQFNRIPFLFLTAKSTPEDVRLGKMLGVDDYITKPFKKEDLLASISGKINRNRKTSLIDNKIKELLTFYQKEMQPSISEDETLPFCLLVMFWDDKEGPVLSKSHPSDQKCHISINTIGNQLFHAATSIYGHDKITKAEGILLNIENFKRKGYAYFDAFPDKNERYGEKQYMLSIIAPNITYFDSLKVREVLKEISEKIKKNQDWDIDYYWEKILEILSKSSLLLRS